VQENLTCVRHGLQEVREVPRGIIEAGLINQAAKPQTAMA